MTFVALNVATVAAQTGMPPNNHGGPMNPGEEKCAMMPPGPDQGRCFDAIPCATLMPGAPPEHLAECEREKVENKERMNCDNAPPGSARGDCHRELDKKYPNDRRGPGDMNRGPNDHGGPGGMPGMPGGPGGMQGNHGRR